MVLDLSAGLLAPKPLIILSIYPNSLSLTHVNDDIASLNAKPSWSWSC